MDSTLQRYLNDIGRTALLTHEEEIKYGKQVQQMIFLQAARDILASELKRSPTLNEWLITQVASYRLRLAHWVNKAIKSPPVRKRGGVYVKRNNCHLCYHG